MDGEGSHRRLGHHPWVGSHCRYCRFRSHCPLGSHLCLGSHPFLVSPCRLERCSIYPHCLTDFQGPVRFLADLGPHESGMHSLDRKESSLPGGNLS